MTGKHVEVKLKKPVEAKVKRTYLSKKIEKATKIHGRNEISRIRFVKKEQKEKVKDKQIKIKNAEKFPLTNIS